MTKNYTVTDTTNGTTTQSDGSHYVGPVGGIWNQYGSIFPDAVNITANVPSTFIRAGPLNDSIDVSRVNGNNILDGSTGLTGVFTNEATGGLAAVTLAGYSQADPTNGRLTLAYGHTADIPGLPGSDYLLIHGNRLARAPDVTSPMASGRVGVMGVIKLRKTSCLPMRPVGPMPWARDHTTRSGIWRPLL